MTNSDVFVCGCQGSGETIDKALQNVNVEGIRFVSAQRACRDGIATVLDAKNKTSGARCFVGCTQEPPLSASGMSGMPPPVITVAPSSTAFQ